MNTIVRFDQKSFKKGVNDALTLAPLREAIMSIALNHSTGKTVVVKNERSTKGDVKHGKQNASGCR